MASRRARIKTCANIPIRKKNVPNEGEIKKESAVIQKSTEEAEVKSHSEENSDIRNNKDRTETEHAEKCPIETIKDVNSENESEHKNNNDVFNKDDVNIVQPDQSNHDASKEINKAVNNVQNTERVEKMVEENENAQMKDDCKSDDNKHKNESVAKKVDLNVKPAGVGIRRRFIKPTISNNVISRAVKNKSNLDSSNDINSNKIEISSNDVKNNDSLPLEHVRIVNKNMSENIKSVKNNDSLPSEHAEIVNKNNSDNIKSDSLVSEHIEEVNEINKQNGTEIDEVLKKNNSQCVTKDNSLCSANVDLIKKTSQKEVALEKNNGTNRINSTNSTSTDEQFVVKDSLLSPCDLNEARTEKKTFSSPSANGVTYLGKPSEGVNDKGVNINLNETSLPTCNNSICNNEDQKFRVLDVVKLPKPQYIDGTKSGSDTEYPPPAVSPNKFVNRPRIKAIPRLGRQQQRRTSFSIGSASESEDDTRKTTTNNRIRNDSVCSAVSANGDTSLTTDLSPQKKEYSSVIQRKCRRTEQSRKLAEARRDFMLKFRNEKPDRQRLTMMDLIFYNPPTSPMSQKKKRNDTSTSITIDESESIDNPDDPKINNNDEASDGDEENTVPAPQITIGANGEIIVDEKSLVIENKATIKGREALKQSQIINGDFDTSYGVYKRVKRSKDWSKDETLRFYKALNTIGTDFTMMSELFPGRTRRELKMKFKKEERMNKLLVDRAVMQPVQFDMTELRRELEVAEIEKKEAERLKNEIKGIIRERAEKNNNKRKRVKTDTNDSALTLDTTEKPVSDQVKKRVRKVNKRKKHQAIVQNGINSLLDSDSDSSTLSKLSTPSTHSKGNADSDSDNEETKPKTQMTKSGRISRPRKSLDTVGLNGTDDNRKNGEKKINSFKQRKGEKRSRISSNESDCSEDDIPIGKIQMTKSGRISKPRKLSSQSENSVKQNEDKFIPEDTDSQDGLTPGSLMILNDVDENGEPIQKIYTVNEDGEKVPIDLTQDILDDLMKSLPDCNTSINEMADNSLANLSLGINAEDLVIDDDMLVIPFDELMAEQSTVKV